MLQQLSFIFFLIILQNLVTAAGNLSASKVLDSLHALQSRDGEVYDLYAVDEDISDARKEWLKLRLEAQRKSQYQERYQYTVEDLKQNEGMAMAVVSVRDETNPFFLNTISVGFCLAGDLWKPAPISGQFTLSGYGKNTLKEIKLRNELEKWADETEQSIYKRLKNRVNQIYQKEIAKHRAEGKPLVDGSKEEAVQYFIEMCREKDLCGLVASLSEGADSDNVTMLVSQALQSRQSRWSTLMHKNYAYCILPQVEDAEAKVSVGLYLPRNTQKQQIIEFEVEEASLGWTISIPQSLDFQENGELKRNVFSAYDLTRGNRNRLDSVKSEILKSMRSPEKRDLIDGIESFYNALKYKNLQFFLESVSWGCSIKNEGENLSDEEVPLRLEASLSLWSDLSKSTSNQLRELKRIESDNSVLIQWMNYPLAKPYALSVRAALFVRKEGRLRLVPEFDAENLPETWLVSENQRRAMKNFKERLSSEVLAKMLNGALYLDEEKLEEINPANFERIEELCDKLLKRILEAEVEEKSRLLALYKGKEKQTLHFMGTLSRWIKDPSTDYIYKETVSYGKLAFAVLEIRYKDATESVYVGLPLVENANTGLRFLPIYKYMYEHGGGQKIVNKKMLDGLKAEREDVFLDDYFIVVEKFNKAVQSQLDSQK